MGEQYRPQSATYQFNCSVSVTNHLALMSVRTRQVDGQLRDQLNCLAQLAA